MQIVMIGTGNVATVLATKLVAAGHNIVQVFGRNQQAAAALASICGASLSSSWTAINQQADLYILALPDKAFADNTVQLQLQDQLVVHTAGAVSMQVLKNISGSYGVLYPLQTIRKEVMPLPEIPFLVDANTIAAREKLIFLANTISGKVTMADDAARMQYHLCAVMGNNFSNYLYVLAEDFCIKNGLDFSMLLPLIDETAHRLHRFSPREVQTGPGIRNDSGTIQRHLQLLDDEPALQNLYKILSAAIIGYPWQ